MSLTGFPLTLLAGFSTIAAVAVTMVLWNRFGRLRYVTRATGILLAEVLLLFTFALAVNRSEEFYPTWAVLLGTRTTDETVVRSTDDSTYRSAPGALDHRLADAAGGRTGAPLTFPWQSADWRGWGLNTAPIVIVPPGYLQHPTWSYSAVVVIGDGPTGWTVSDDEAAARRATATGISAVVVFATTAATPAPTLAAALPDQLDRDLRVTTHHWAMVTSAADATLAQNAVVAAATRYRSIAVVTVGAHAGVPGNEGRPSGPTTTTATGLVLPAGVNTAVVVSNALAVKQAGAETLPSTPADALYTALSWAIERTSPPLASNVPPGRPTSGASTSAPSEGAGGSPSLPLPPRR